MGRLFEKRKAATSLLPPFPKQVHNQVHRYITTAITPLKIKGLGSGFDSHRRLTRDLELGHGSHRLARPDGDGNGEDLYLGRR